MGNVLFPCCTHSSKAGSMDRRRRCLWDDLLSNCVFEAPSKRSKLTIAKNLSRNEPGPDSEWLPETMSSPGWRDSPKQRKSTEHGSITVDPESSPDSLRSTSEGRQEVNPDSRSSPIYSRPTGRAGESSKQHDYELQHVWTQTSSSSPLRRVSPDKTMRSLDDNFNRLASPPSRASPISGSCTDLTCSSPIRGSSPDTMRKIFNQYCSQQRHLASTKRRQIPRRQNKVSPAKPRRKRTGMRSVSKSPGGAVGGRVDDNNVDKRHGMRSPSSKIYNFRTLEKLLRDGEEQNGDMSFLSPKTSAVKTLRRALSEIIEDSEVNSDGMCNGCRSPKKTLHWSLEDNEHAEAPYTTVNDSQVTVKSPLSRGADDGAQYTSFHESRVVVTSPISRRAALALIGRQRGIGYRKNAVSLGEHGRRIWTPALDSILEAADVENLQFLESSLAKKCMN